MAVRRELTPPILSLTLDRPKANAFDQAQLDALSEALDAAAAVDGARVLVVFGAGERAFSAGADLTGVGPLGEPAGLGRWTAQAHSALDRIESFPVPVIAAVQRPAVGGGFELALACHLRVLGSAAHVGLPEIRRGYLPSWAGLERLSRVIGIARASDLLLTGRAVEAPEALALGIVHRVADDADAAARALAAELADLPPLAVRAAVAQIAGVRRGDDVATVRARELSDLERLVRTEDTVEGVLAFLEKRTPVFHGR